MVSSELHFKDEFSVPLYPLPAAHRGMTAKFISDAPAPAGSVQQCQHAAAVRTSSHLHRPLHSKQRDLPGLSSPSGTPWSPPAPGAPVHRGGAGVSAGRLCSSPAAHRSPQHLPWGLSQFSLLHTLISTASPCYFFIRCNLSSK